MQKVSIRRVLTVGVVLAAATGVLASSSAQPVPTESRVDVRAQHDRAVGSAGPFELRRSDGTAGPGPELTLGTATEVHNPSGWDGNVLVDVDPDAQTITVAVENQGCYDDVLVTVWADFIASVETVTDNLFDPAGSPVTLTAARLPSDPEGVTFHWVSEDGDCPGLNAAGSEAVFSYERRIRAFLTIEYTEPVRVGDLVTVTGSLCPNRTAEVVVIRVYTPDPDLPYRETVIDTQAQGDANGVWTYVIDTSEFEEGAHAVYSRCVLADGSVVEYDVEAFALFAQTTPPAEPVPAGASFAG